jgi:RND family efflux transporter MFP subunit
MNEPDAPKSKKRFRARPDVAFDSFDEDAQVPDATPQSHAPKGKPDKHGHVPVPTTYAPKTGRRLSLFAGVIAIALLVGFFLVNHARQNEAADLREDAALRVRQAQPVEFVRARSTSPTQTLVLPGETRGWYNSTIYARVTGYVAQWLVDIGDVVKKDQVMAIIDTPDLDAQLEGARAQLKASEAEAKVKEAEADFAKTTYVRWQTSPKGAVSDQEREDKKARYDSSVAQLNAAAARVNLDRANVDRLTFLTRFKQVTAPYDGVITERRVDIGDLVAAGSTNTTPLFGVAQFDRIRIFTDVPQSARVALGVGRAARITAAELPKRVFEGKVTRTSESEDPHARTQRVEIDLPNDDRALVPGLYVQVAFELPPAAAIQVPAGALIFRGSRQQVAVITDGDVVKFRDVTIARDNGKFIEIGSGVNVDDRIAVNINNQVVDGEKVSAREVAEGTPKTAKRN